MSPKYKIPRRIKRLGASTNKALKSIDTIQERIEKLIDKQENLYKLISKNNKLAGIKDIPR